MDADGAMVSPRLLWSIVLLNNGQVLAVGDPDDLDLGDPGATTSAELYDPSTGTWRETGEPLNELRDLEFSTTKLDDGRVLVAGGSAETAEIYDPATDTWSPTGSMAASRGGHLAIALPSGRVLVAGGFGDAGEIATAESFDPQTGTWRSESSMSNPRKGAEATVLDDDRVLVVGGLDGTNINGDAEIFDPQSGIWTPTGPLAAARVSATLTPLGHGLILLIGGAQGFGAFDQLDSMEMFHRNTTVDVSPVQFGSQIVDTESGEGFAAVHNTGTAPLVLGPPTIGGDDFDVGDNRCPPVLDVGARCLIGVTFTPSEVGPLEGELLGVGQHRRRRHRPAHRQRHPCPADRRPRPGRPRCSRPSGNTRRTGSQRCAWPSRCYGARRP